MTQEMIRALQDLRPIRLTRRLLPQMLTAIHVPIPTLPLAHPPAILVADRYLGAQAAVVLEAAVVPQVTRLIPRPAKRRS